MAKTLLQQAKLQRTGTVLEEPLASQLKEQLLQCVSYKKAANKEDMVLKVLTKRIYGRKMKTVFICYGSTSIPIVATRLYAPKNKTGCRTCSKTRCSRTSNNVLLRKTIEEQIKRFRNRCARRVTKLRVIGAKRTASEGKEFNKLTTCALSGAPLTKVHVDHVIPFVELVKRWSTMEDIDLCKKRLTKKQLESWNTYHEQEAELQLTCAKANMKAGAKGYKT